MIWRCFHCGFIARTKQEAEAHFGDESGLPPLCITWYDMTKKERIAEFQQLVIELEQTREELCKVREELEQSKRVYLKK